MASGFYVNSKTEGIIVWVCFGRIKSVIILGCKGNAFGDFEPSSNTNGDLIVILFGLTNRILVNEGRPQGYQARSLLAAFTFFESRLYLSMGAGAHGSGGVRMPPVVQDALSSGFMNLGRHRGS